MTTRSIVASAAFACALAAFLAWKYREGEMGGLAIGVIAMAGLVIVALANFFYGRMWQDDED
jgi:hypothetical protein